MSLSCCCRICLGCDYYYYEFSLAGESTWTFSAPYPPEIPDVTLYYFARGRTPIDDPFFTAYNTHVWIWEACTYSDHRGTYGELSDMVDQFHADNMALAGISGELLNFGTAGEFIGFPDEYGDPYHIGHIKSAFMPSASNYTIEEYLNMRPPNWGKCLPL